MQVLVLATCIYLGLQCNAAPLHYIHRRAPGCSNAGGCNDILVRDTPSTLLPGPSSLPPSAPPPVSVGSPAAVSGSAPPGGPSVNGLPSSLPASGSPSSLPTGGPVSALPVGGPATSAAAGASGTISAGAAVPTLSNSPAGNVTDGVNATSPPASPSPGAAPSNSTGNSGPTGSPDGKLVFAHFMVGNAYPYQAGDWQKDISLAHQANIDGFALNIGKDTWGPARVKDAYDAAQGSNTGFKMFLSLDMSSLGCASASDGPNLRSLVSNLLSHPAQLQYNGKAVVSTFSGETCTFGAGSPADGWKSQFTQHPDLQGKIFFIPSFMIDPATFSQYQGVMDGDFNWNGAWPVDLTPLGKRDVPSSAALPSSNAAVPPPSAAAPPSTAAIPPSSMAGPPSTAAVPPSSAAVPPSTAATPPSSGVAPPTSTGSASADPHSNEVGSFTPDQSYLSGLKALGNAVYMASVSPWFFTHYSSKNWIYLSDDHLYAKRWESLVQNRNQVNLAEIISWNDYGESHYIGPLGEGQAPDQTTWISGMPHTGWLDMTSYYATAFKTGSYPTIAKDQIYMWSRPHPANSQASGDSLGPPKGSDLTTDTVWAVVMATADGSVTLKTSDSSSQTFTVKQGVSKLSLPITSGGTMQATLSRNGQTVLNLNPQDFKFNDTAATYNFNAYVASTGSS